MALDRKINEGWVGVLFGTLVCASFGTVFSLFFISAWIDVQDARAWTPVPCHILASETSIPAGPGRQQLQFLVRYAYSPNGHAYESSRYSFLSERLNLLYDRKYLYGLERRYPAGAQTTCFVNPGNLAEAVLDRDYPDSFFIAGSVVAVPALIGILMILGGLGSVFRRAWETRVESGLLRRESTVAITLKFISREGATRWQQSGKMPYRR